MNRLENPEDFLPRLVGDYADMIFRIALIQLKNWHDAEDIVQRVFIELYETWPSFDSEEHIKSWLIRVTIHRCKDCLKSAWRRRTVPLNEEILGIEHEVSDITRAVLSLSPQNRQVIVLHYYIGYSINEIAALTGKKASAVATMLHRTRKKLKLDMNETYEL
jgi:RNA polymerase sigma-70 factor (ECF subfamily)